MIKISHKGCTDNNPDNSIEAFESAIKLGADILEIDVNLTEDSFAVITHDPCRKVKFKDLDKNISSLSEVLDFVDKRVEVILDIKNPSNINNGIEELVCDILSGMDYSDDVIVSSFNHFSLLKFKDINPKLRLGMLYNCTWINFEQELETIKPYSIHPELDITYNDQVRNAYKNGYKVYPWIAKSEDDINELRKFKYVHGVMVDDLKLF